MPELPEVETVVNGLNAKIEGRQVLGVQQFRKNLRYDFPENLADMLLGGHFGVIVRRAKFMIITVHHSAASSHIIAHLGMSGRFTVQARQETHNVHDHLVIDCDDDCQLVYHDPRRFGFIIDGGVDPYQHRFLAKLGPEPLGNQCDAQYLFAKLQSSNAPIKSRLLDQGVIAGLGNIYVCEALWQADISPWRASCDIDMIEATQLLHAVQIILRSAIADGGSSLRDYRKADGELGYFQTRWMVYGNAGTKCKKDGCDGDIMRTPQSGRSSFHCSVHQK